MRRNYAVGRLSADSTERNQFDQPYPDYCAVAGPLDAFTNMFPDCKPKSQDQIRQDQIRDLEKVAAINPDLAQWGLDYSDQQVRKAINSDPSGPSNIPTWVPYAVGGAAVLALLIAVRR